MRASVPPLALLVLAGCAETPTMKAFNTPPAVGITSPEDGAQFDQGVRIDFTALVADDPTPAPDVALTWTSDRDGVLSDAVRADATGQVFFSASTLSAGAHAITLTAVDPQGEQSVAAVDVEIVALPAEPTITLRSPIPGHAGAEGLATEFTVQVSDPQQAADTLEVLFQSDLDGTFCTPAPDASGRASCAATLSPTPGDPAEAFHRLVFRVTDAEGLSAETTFAWHVAPAAPPEVDQDGDGQLASEGDCNDLDAAVHGGASEACDGLDNDCDLSVDEGLTDTFWRDSDGDNQGDATQSTQACVPPDGYVANDWDCDDTQATAFVGGSERCDGVDNDCDGATDEGLLTVFYTDADADGQGDAGHTVAACTASLGLVSNRRDCDDDDPLAFEGAPERCNAKDDDCDGTVDDGALLTWYADVDGDSYGAAASATGACAPPIGHVGTSGDCDDASAVSHPGAPELADARDNDCDGVADEGTNLYDDDGDGFAELEGGAFPGGDCDDAVAAVMPGAVETLNGVDDDCNQRTDDRTEAWDDDGDGLSEQQGDCDDTDAERHPGAAYLEPELCAADADNDGWAAAADAGSDCDDAADGTYPGAPETCWDGADSDCDGTENDEDAQYATDYYVDEDGDNYGVGSARWLCEEDVASGFTGWYPGDCYDANANARPYQWQYFTVHRGDGSFDYNCSGAAERQYTLGARCTTLGCYVEVGNEGWTSTVPGCGQSAGWSTGDDGCSASWSLCDLDANATMTQACR